MILALWALATLVAAVVLGIAYMTLAVNAVANRQDRVLSVPSVTTERDAFIRAVGAAAGQPCLPGNDVTLYQNGNEIFPPMLAAIKGARSTVHFATYVYWAGHIPEVFAAAFSAAAQRGVQVRLVLDREGTEPMSPAVVKRMRAAGCVVVWFNRMRWFDWTRYNRRSHRRLLIVDGRIGFTGGVGIADEWAGMADSPKSWRDTHVRVTGPVVAALQSAFLDSWNQSTEELLLNQRDFPPLEPTGDVIVGAVVSTPANGTSAAQRVMAAFVAGAARTLHVTNAYFVPTPAFIDALCAASARGVDVKIVTPGPYNDQPIVRRASRHSWRRLVEGGVAVHEYQPTMIHAKTLVVDSEIILVGSINFDPRSFALNAECGVIVADSALARRMEEVFAIDLAHCRRMDIATLDALGPLTRIVDAMCYWARAQL